MERLTIEYDGLYAPKKMCSINRLGEADDCDSCEEVCKEKDSSCVNCPIQECFDKLAQYEETELTPEQIEAMKGHNIALIEQLKEYQQLEKQIEDIIREEEHYQVSNSFNDPHPNKADYDAVAADKFQRIWQAVSNARENNLLS